jgi:hypothetical protein
MNRKVHIVKKNAAAPSKFGTNPSDPWSTKANIAEDKNARARNLLRQFLLAKGLNPDTVTKNVRIAHTKTGEFEKWKKNHQFEEVDLDEAMTKKEKHEDLDNQRETLLKKAKEGAVPGHTAYKLLAKIANRRDHIDSLKEEEQVDESRGTYRRASTYKAAAYQKMRKRGKRLDFWNLPRLATNYKKTDQKKQSEVEAAEDERTRRKEEKNEEVETLDSFLTEEDTVTLNIPLMIRMLGRKDG